MGHLTLYQAWREIGRFGEWFDLEERALAIPAKLAHAVRLCLEEAVDNLINYTSTTAEGPRIDIELGRQGDTLVAVVRDYGPPFDPRTVPAFSPAKDLETMQPGGWGVHLIRSYATEIDYATGADGNRLTLRFTGSVGPAV
ncbi:ATP-binding protein [Acidocella sp.]|jgi:anti-sigma regulatory factor (Ser/Thr protein kinase)|uniref:ATP-binding protein n=1 Tax=Acidocella sp. TaxID=50710 RepID=UPI002F41831C